MRLDHLLSREEEVEERKVLFSYEDSSDACPREGASLGRGRAAYTSEKPQANASELATLSVSRCARTTEFAKFLVVMRLGDTPVLIPNTMVKTYTADGTMLETAWESRWLPELWAYSSAG